MYLLYSHRFPPHTHICLHMYWYELTDVMLLVNSLKYPGGGLNILDHISFVSSTTRASSYAKISLKKAHLNVLSHSFFFRIARLRNCLSYVDLHESACGIHKNLASRTSSGHISLQILTVIMYTHSILFVHVTNVLHYHVTPIIMIYVRYYVVLLWHSMISI